MTPTPPLLGASAIVKLVIAEAETGALRSYVAERTNRFTSQIARIEVGRAVGRALGPGAADMATVDDVMDRIFCVRVDDQIVAAALRAVPTSLRTLVAIHLVSALVIGDELEAFVGYDTRLIEAARMVGLPVVAPR